MRYEFPDALLMLFCKAPQPGLVKTRLTPILSPEQACDIHIKLSLNTLQLATQTKICPVQLWCAPSTEHDFFSTVAKNYPITLRQQQGNDLGERMQHAFCGALKSYSQALLMGCDCPSLTANDLHEALVALQQTSDIVLAPAEDGGYVLIGLNQLQPSLFLDMPWGTNQVLDQTRQQIQTLGLRHHELNQQWDVDTPEDLARFLAHDEIYNRPIKRP